MLRYQSLLFLLAPVVVIFLFVFGSPVQQGAVAAVVEEQTEQVMLAEQGQTFEVAASVAGQVAVQESFVVVEEPVVGWPSSDHDITWGQGNFGSRSCRGCTSNHHGIDFNPGPGAPIVSAVNGTVTNVTCGGALGCQVWVQQELNGVPTGVVTVYAHMVFGSFAVVQGQHVSVGQLLGACGETGLATGTHLHFEVHINGQHVDPWVWLQANENAEDWNWLLDK